MRQPRSKICLGAFVRPSNGYTLMRARACAVESLESRRMLSGSTVTSFASFVTNAANGAGIHGSSASDNNPSGVPGISTDNNTLTLTTQAANEASSAFFSSPVYYTDFTASFVYTALSGNPPADGVAFTLQDDSRGVNALGGGGDLGYGSDSLHPATIISPSFAIEFNIYNGSTTSDATNGAITATVGASTSVPTGSVNLASGDPISVSLTYNSTASTVTESLTDTVTNATFSTVYTSVNLASILRNGTAYLGFTGGTGANTAQQTISNLNYSASMAPQVNLTSSFNSYGIGQDGEPAINGGFDGGGYSFSGTLLGTTQTVTTTPIGAQTFILGAAGTPNTITASGQTIALPQGNYGGIAMLAAAGNGNQGGQTITFHYTNGTSTSYTHSFSDWFTPQNYPNEISIPTAYRLNPQGGQDDRTFDLYEYTFPVNRALTVQSITLPSDTNIKVFSINVSAKATSLVINTTFDSTVTSLPNAAQVENAFNYAAQQYESLVSNPIILNITVKASAGTSVFGQSGFTYSYSYSYQQIKAALQANSWTTASAAAIASLGADPTNGGSFDLNFAQAKALGLRSFNDPASDGTFTFGSGQNFDYSTTNRAIPGEYDFIGVAEHEISEIMGRDAGLGRGSPALYDSYDLFRYTAPGVRSMVSGATGVYFSINGGVTDLRGFEPTIDQDDWIDTTPYTPDAYVEYTESGYEDDITPTDLIVVNTLGYTPSSTSPKTVTTVNSSNLSSGYGQPVTLSAAITPVNGSNETGTVQFQVDGRNVGTPVTLSGNNATFTTSTLGVGQHYLTAIYSGDGNFNGSTSTPVQQIISRAATSTALQSSANPATRFQPVTFTATVTPGSGSGETGTVQFQIDGSNVGSPVTVSNGTAAFTTSTLTPGMHSIVAVYSGDSNFAGSTSPTFTQSVAQVSTSTAVTANAASPTVGQPVTFTATITPADGSGETGTVQFQIDGSDVGSPGTVSNGTAAYTTSTLTAGSHSIVAVYSGDSNFTGSTSPTFTQNVVAAPAPTVVSVTTNDGEADGNTTQASEVRQLVVTFSQAVNLTQPGAFTLGVYNLNGTGGAVSGNGANDGSITDISSALNTATSTDGGVTWTITFAASTANTDASASLIDGIYSFAINNSDVTSNGVALTGSNTYTFHRLYGDVTGAGAVNNTDARDFSEAYGAAAGSANYNAALDSGGAGANINNTDARQFSLRYGQTFSSVLPAGGIN